jgi:hypothetical protein
MNTELPSINITAQETDPGWRRVETGEVVKTWYQTYSLFPKPRWVISSYWSSEGYVNRGRANYRQPLSFKAWMTVVPQLVAKVWKRLKNGWKLP